MNLFLLLKKLWWCQ